MSRLSQLNKQIVLKTLCTGERKAYNFDMSLLLNALQEEKTVIF